MAAFNQQGIFVFFPVLHFRMSLSFMAEEQNTSCMIIPAPGIVRGLSCDSNDSLEITEVLNSWIEPPVDGVAGLGGLTVQAHCLISGYSSPTATASDVRSS